MLHFPARRRHVEMNPRVGVDPLHARHDALELNGFGRIELRRERVMCERRQRGGCGEHSSDNAHYSTHRYVLHLCADRFYFVFFVKSPYSSSSENSTHLNSSNCAFGSTNL